MVDGPDNALAPFAHLNVGPAGVDQAVEIAARAERPVVLYGPDMTAHTAQALETIDRAGFIALQPGVNTQAAIAFGLNGPCDLSAADLAFVVAGEQDWDGQELPADGAVVALASYRSALTERADVVLPAAIWSERSGSLTNLEGRVLPVSQAVAPQGQAQPDWQILSALAARLGKTLPATLADISAQAREALG